MGRGVPRQKKGEFGRSFSVPNNYLNKERMNMLASQWHRSLRNLVGLATGVALWFSVGCTSSETGSTSSTSNTPRTSTDSPAAATTPTAKPPQRVKMDVAEIDAAKIRVRDVAMQIGFLTDDAGFEKSITGVNNAQGKIDIEAALKDIAMLSKLPDNTENEFIPVLSKSLVPIKESCELYKKSLDSKKPFSDGSGNGPKMAKLAGDNHLNLVVAVDASKKHVDPVD